LATTTSTTATSNQWVEVNLGSEKVVSKIILDTPQMESRYHGCVMKLQGATRITRFAIPLVAEGALLCPVSSYWGNGACVTCPSGTTAPAGSTLASQCVASASVPATAATLATNTATMPTGAPKTTYTFTGPFSNTMVAT
jgi:hypothetical protein